MPHIASACLLLGCVCAVAAGEVEDLMQLLEQKVYELSSTEELTGKLLERIRIARDCSLSRGEIGVAVLKKMIVPIISEATPCASGKSGIPDPVERDLAEKVCFKDVAMRTQATVGLTDDESAAFEVIAPCIFSQLPAVQA
ncbi:hypothetical protein V5799_013954 [Amblyomma americanum]|uniref:Secreted protein n=1 Tax=Amblyomma americanum TaxID=6943 RepID=A0AAQ4E4F9_AMBAM